MIDIGSISSAVSSLKAAGDIAKGLISLTTTAEVLTKVIELSQKILDAQHTLFEANAAQTALVDRVRELEGEIAAMKDWDHQKQRYQLATPHTGVLVYAVKKAISDGEPPHYLCALCFNNAKHSILQTITLDNWALLTCFVCKSSVPTGYRGASNAKYAEDIPSPA